MHSGATVIPPHPRSIIQSVAIPTVVQPDAVFLTPMPILRAAISDLNKSISATNLMDPTKDEDDHFDEDHRLLLRSSI